MKDKMWIMSSDLFPATNPLQKFVLWNGTTWILDEERWYTYCQEMATRGVNMFRWLGWNVWNSDHNLTPFIQQENGLYDLNARNNVYWQIIEKMIEIANYPSQNKLINAPGIVINIDLFYQYKKDKDDIANSPWRNNTLGVKDLYDPRLKTYVESYITEWANLKKKGLKIEIGIGNELLEDSLEFCNEVLRVLDKVQVWPFSWGICPELPLIENALFKKCTKVIKNENLFMWYPLRHTKEWEASIKRPVHHVGRPYKGLDVLKNVLENWGQNPIGKICSDDGCMGADGKPNAKEWFKLITQILTYKGNTNAVTKDWKNIDKPYFGIEHLPDDEPWDFCREQQLEVFEAIAQTYAKYIEPLENYGKWPVEYIEPECKLGEVKTEVCWDGSVITTHICENYKWEPTNLTCPVKPSHKCGLDHWWQHFKKSLNFKAAFLHLIGKHNW